MQSVLNVQYCHLPQVCVDTLLFPSHPFVKTSFSPYSQQERYLAKSKAMWAIYDALKYSG